MTSMGGAADRIRFDRAGPAAGPKRLSFSAASATPQKGQIVKGVAKGAAVGGAVGKVGEVDSSDALKAGMASVP